MIKNSLQSLLRKYAKKQPITMVTAYDHPSAVHVDKAGIDACLVGDSVGMTVHGYKTTLQVTMEEMLLHCKAVARGTTKSFLIGDLPFGSYETSDQAVENAKKLTKDGGMDAVKMEGGDLKKAVVARAMVDAGMKVMGHIGLTPQSVDAPGGFKVQGKTLSSAIQVLDHAKALQEAGCFAVVLECIPSPLAAALTSSLKIPTIGIGAGPFCSGQILVYHDVLGISEKCTYKFCKEYVQVRSLIEKGLAKYQQEVSNGEFPTAQHTYQFNPGELDMFLKHLKDNGNLDALESAEQAELQKK